MKTNRNMKLRGILWGVFVFGIWSALVLAPRAMAQVVSSGTIIRSGQGVLGGGAPVYHAGDIIRISVTFEGPDAGKIRRAAVDMRISASAKDQPGFAIDLYAGESRPTTPNTFEVSIKIPANQASGDYKLGMMRGFVDEPNVMLQYDAPGDFKERIYTIENREHFVKPTIKDIKEP
jgi:hypothetical protein